MAPVPLVQQQSNKPEHGKARRAAQVIGADRVLPNYVRTVRIVS
jgi:hypothetical protein